MSSVYVDCWKCDECGHRWIKTEVWPERCASSKCRKRTWNKGAVKSSGAVDPPAESKPVTLPAVADSAPVELVPDLSTLSVADRLAVARQALAKVSAPVGEILPPAGVASPMFEPCTWRDPADEAGDIYGCALGMGHKGRHVKGPKVGDIW